jgi:hypothetical protein
MWPDISFTVNMLMCFNNNPHPFHWTLVKHCITYLKTTANLVITYQKGINIKPYGFADAFYAGNFNSWKSTAGYIFLFSGEPVSWKSMTQWNVSTSTSKTKYVSTCKSGKQARWMYSWYTEVDQSFNLLIIIIATMMRLLQQCKTLVATANWSMSICCGHFYKVTFMS